MNFYFFKCNETELKRQRAFAGCLFKYALEKEKGITDVGYVKDERGKPYIPGTDIHMSLSHCKAGIVCVIADFPVGIDIEEVSRINLRIASKICTENELSFIENTQNKQELLCRFWVLKEAYSKLTGQGFSAGFCGIDTLEGLKSRRFHTIKKDGEPPLYVGLALERVALSEPREVIVTSFPQSFLREGFCP
ncbi:MAG: 4'-phosphopantetheinyl transferase superfamily protein [Oscillospiraceae bacterium]|nr:4'-phosphopantetheinyl transferase superfamily protein [Oscillospiraceae bacterium]